MDVFMATIRGVLTLDEVTFRAFLKSENAMKRGFLIMLICFLIGTFRVFGESLISSIRGFTPDLADDFRSQFVTMFEQFQPPDMGNEDVEQFLDDFLIGVNIGVDIDALPTPLPRPIAAFFTALGAWVTAAVRGIGPWLSYGVIVLLFAKLAGGRGVINPFFVLTALYGVPSLLRIFSFVPFLGSVFVLVAIVWGIFIYIRAVQIGQDFSAGKAIFITILPVLILTALTACLGSVALAGMGSLIAAGR